MCRMLDIVVLFFLLGLLGLLALLGALGGKLPVIRPQKF